MGKISKEEMLEYVVRLYNHANATETNHERLSTDFTNPFTFKDAEVRLKKMANGKAFDNINICAELLK